MKQSTLNKTFVTTTSTCTLFKGFIGPKFFNSRHFREYDVKNFENRFLCTGL